MSRNFSRIIVDHFGLWLFGLLLLVAGIAAYIGFKPPLVKSHAYSVNYSENGVARQDAVLLRPLTMSGPFYIHLPSHETNRYSWFGLDVQQKSVFVPIAIYKAPFGRWAIHRDQANGINLLDGKIEDSWNVSFETTEIQFHNSSLKFTVRKTNDG